MQGLSRPARLSYHTRGLSFSSSKKEYYLKRTELQEATFTLGLEQEIADVVEKVCLLREDELAELNYTPVKLAKKFNKNELLLKNKVSIYVTNYYPYVRDLFKGMEGTNGFRMDTLNLQIKSCFIKMDGMSHDKSLIFEQMVEWIMAKTLSKSRDACEAVISFFVQNCEVFNEITE